MPTRLKIAFVAPSLRILGGQAVQADRLLSAWKNDQEIEAWLVPVNPLPLSWLRWTLDVKYARTAVTELTYFPLLARELSRADVVHIFSASYSSFLLAPLPAMVVARALGKPIVLNYRSGQAPDHLKRSAIARRSIARVDLNIVPSRFLVDVFRGFGIDASIIPNIVDPGLFRYRERNPLRPRLLSTRNFDALYNVAATIRAFRAVQDRWPDATLTLVGGGSEEGALRALAGELGLRNVTFAGRVNPDEIARFYTDNDIYVQSPNIDNMPTSVLEAFACGLPVVSTEAGGVPAILTHGEHGLLAPLADWEAMGRQILTLLDDPDYARSLAANAHATTHAYTWPSVRHEWVRAYRSVLRAQRRSNAVAIEDSDSRPGARPDFPSASAASSAAKSSR
jgi:glycosyltransferase involved in cell wall biosynthesis